MHEIYVPGAVTCVHCSERPLRTQTYENAVAQLRLLYSLGQEPAKTNGSFAKG